MKNLALALFVISTAGHASTSLKCSTSVAGRVESFKVKIGERGRPIFWSKTKILDTTPESYFRYVSSIANFGIESKSSFIAKNGYRILSLTNTAETVKIGVSPDLTKAFYAYQDGGSGNGNEVLALDCHQI